MPARPTHAESLPFWQGMRLALRWLLVVLLVADLIGAPMHAHRHDGELSPAGMAQVLDHLVVAGAQSHAEEETPIAASHSATAVARTATLRLASIDTAALLAVICLFEAAVLLLSLPGEARRAAAHGALRPIPRNLPPDGRAPPRRA